jgi:predicted DNA-binding transcriptional regulator AlpA
MSGKLLTTSQARKKLGDISTQTLWRRRQVVAPKPIFPKPICINGRNYFWDDELDAWVEAQAEAGTPTRDIPNADDGRAKGREKLAAITAAKKELSKLIDQLGHNGGPPLDDAIEKVGPPAIKAGRNKRGGKNG